jgi:hypothetical protein
MSEVSVWLKASEVIESTLVGHARFVVGAELGLFKSYTEIPEWATANEGSLRWREIELKPKSPSQVAIGALFEGVLYGSNSFTVLSVPHDRSF